MMLRGRPPLRGAAPAGAIPLVWLPGMSSGDDDRPHLPLVLPLF